MTPRTATLAGLILCALLLGGPAPLQARSAMPSYGLEARETALVHDRGFMSVGLQDPLRWAPARGIELQTHPLLLVGSPNVRVRVGHLVRTTRFGPVRLTGEYGLFFPSPAFHLPVPVGLQGYFTPTCAVKADDESRAGTCQRPGWILVPNVGLLFSWGERHVLTARVDAAAGILLSGSRGRPRDTWTPLDLKLAPVFNVFRVRLGLRYDRQILRWLRLAARVDLWVVGPGPEPRRDPLVFSAWLGADFALGRYTRLSVGVIYYNADQHRVELREGSDGYGRFVRVRSNDVYPTLDFIWSWSLGPAATAK